MRGIFKNRALRIAGKSVFFALVFLLICASSLALYIVEKQNEYHNRVYPGVYINKTSFEGKTRNDIVAHFSERNAALARTQVLIHFQDTTATFSGETLQLKYDTDTIADQALFIGRSPAFTSRMAQILSSFFQLNTYEFSYKPNFQLDPVGEYLDELSATYSIPPENALFTFSDGKVTSFQVEKPGRELNTRETYDKLVTYLSADTNSIQEHYSFIVTSHEVQPAITIDKANSFGIEEKIGEGTSQYTGSSPEREYNVIHAAQKIHGTLIPPGGTFSYNKTIGDISASTGYKAAYVIQNGRTVLGDGGGVCQDSTTLFRAALNAGLPIVERHAHAYRVRYYELGSKPGIDATVFAPSVDFKFQNDTSAHILIQAVINHEQDALTFELYGKKDGRTVELSEPQVFNPLPAPEPLYEETSTLPAGQTKQVDWAAPGATASFTYKVRNAAGEITQDKVFRSVYRPWRAVYQVGTGS